MAPNQCTQDASAIKDNHDDYVRVVVATKEHRDGLIRLMRDSFLPREPIEATLGTKWEEACESFTQEMDMILQQPYSFVAVHPTEGVVGCRTTRYIPIEAGRPDDPNDFMFASDDSPTLGVFQTITTRLMGGWARELSDRGVRSALQFVTLCVDERFANRGLAKRLVDATMQLAERLRVDCAFALATNKVSQRVLSKAGFVPWRSLDYAEIVNEATGKPYVLPIDGTESIKWVVKTLRHSSAG